MDSAEKSHPTAEQVLAGIGEKAVEAFSRSFRRSAVDLATYRRCHPQWVADHGERGLANWISDRCWAHLLVLADGVPDMTMKEQGVTREVRVGQNYRFRVKRHDYEGNIASYPTQTFLEFVEQPDGQLDGMVEVRLVAGYEWVKESRDIGDAVISLRDGRENIIWKEPLPVFPDAGEGDDDGVADVVTPQSPQPIPPGISVSEEVGKEARETPDQE